MTAVLVLWSSLLLGACGGTVLTPPGGEAGAGGAGGAAPLTSLSANGTIENGCAATIYHAVVVRIGTAPTCDNPGAEEPPYVILRPYPATLEDIHAGDTWSYTQGAESQNMEVAWHPEEGSFAGEQVASASLTLVGMTSEEATVDYAFETLDGTIFDGTVTVQICGPIQAGYCY